jgi:hypothetical protein
MALSFSASPRNVAQGCHVVVLTSGASVAANRYVAAILTATKLLQTQAKQIVGTYLWANKIVPLL